jgi:hypothetical protein
MLNSRDNTFIKLIIKESNMKGITKLVLAMSVGAFSAGGFGQDSSEFSFFKSMEGKWEGVQTRDTGEVVKTQSEFIILSDGNTVLERLVEDGMPMMTTYSEEEGKLIVKHYCSLGTEPEFEAALMGDSKMSLALSPTSGYVSGEADFVNSISYEKVSTSEYVVASQASVEGATQSNRTILTRVD